jgi:hypothetical protein
MVLEVPVGVAVLLGQGHPELHAVQDRGARRGHLGVADAEAAGHGGEFPRPDERVAAQAVAVLDLAAEEPADRPQSGVRVGATSMPPDSAMSSGP